MHSITIRPRAGEEPIITGIVTHRIELSEGVEVVVESTEYLRALARACNTRADAVEAVSA